MNSWMSGGDRVALALGLWPLDLVTLKERIAFEERPCSRSDSGVWREHYLGAYLIGGKRAIERRIWRYGRN